MNGRQKCSNSSCPNRYDDVVGVGVRMKGSICIPCLYAEQMIDQGQTPEQVEGVQHLLEHFEAVLAKAGWTWQHIKDSYRRMAGVAQ